MNIPPWAQAAIVLAIIEAIWSVYLSYYHLPKFLVRRFLEIDRPWLPSAMTVLLLTISLVTACWQPVLGATLFGLTIAKNVIPLALMYFKLKRLLGREPFRVFQLLKNDLRLAPVFEISVAYEHQDHQHQLKVRALTGNCFSLLYVEIYPLRYVVPGKVSPGLVHPIWDKEGEALHCALHDVCERYANLN